MNSKIGALIGAAALTIGAAAGAVVAQSNDEPTTTAGFVVGDKGGGGTSAPLVAAGIPSLFVPVTPYRAYDTRDFADGALISIARPGGRGVALDVISDRDGVQSIPTDATAVTYNVTIVNQDGNGVLVVGDIRLPISEIVKNSTINWRGPGGPIANGSTVVLGEFDGEPGYVGVVAFGGGSTNSRTDFLIDITGYYIAADT